MKPTLQTVADAVGVSRSTVSNAYGRPDQLSPGLREKIFEAARRLGYAGPDPSARSLRRGRAGAIGVLFTDALSYAFTDPYAVQFLRGLAQTAERYETGVLLVPLAGSEEAAIHAVQSAVVDGFCVYCVPDWHWALGAIRTRGLPVVIGEQRTGDPDATYVGIDEWAAARSVGDHLAALGHRRIAVLSDHLVPGVPSGPVALAKPGAAGHRVSRERLRGFADAFAGSGVGWADIMVLNAAANRRAEGATAAGYALDRPHPPTAILACTDLLALGALDALAQRRLRAGVDVSVTGFDGIPEADAAGLTTVAQQAVEKGRIAGRLLLDPPADPAQRQVLLPTELIVRTSTGPASTHRVERSR
jgi:DNA-binding LacI/PurR family transcriptional regulator